MAATATPQDGNDDSAGFLNTAPPATPTESLSDAPTDPALDDEPDIPGDTCAPGQKCPAAGDCDESKWFKPASLGGKYHFAVGAGQSNYNGTHEKQDMDFTATQFSVTLHASVTAELGNAVHVKNVPPGKTVHAQCGVWRRKFTGIAYYQHHTCYLTHNNVTGYGPMCVGWYTWGE
ncbi:hypothetical protein AB0I51_04625 [Streptomyces sp. NPDC050549]|uniref:hypothetical protein n=1 Tax=Streptomyces sp. NPDC050549 TaxID=3155406 RepID=UPI00341E6162